jgi:Ion channel
MTQQVQDDLGNGMSRGRIKAMAHSGVFRFSVARFLIALVVLFVSAPFLEHFKQAKVVESALMTLVLGLGVLAVGARRRTLVLAIVLVLPAVLLNWAHHFWPERWLLVGLFAARMVFVTFVVAHLLGFILRAPRVNPEVLCAGIATYLLLGLLWTFAYVIVEEMAPGSFAFNVPADAAQPTPPFTMFYFSFITLTTVGYGDITPVKHIARTLAMLEAMTGTLFVGVLIARLVSLYSSAVGPSPGPAEEPASSKTQDL